MCPGLTDIVRVYICLFVWHSTTKACNLHTKHNQLKTIFFLPTGPIVVSCCIDGGEAHSVSGQTTDKQLRPPEEQTIVLVPLVAKSISYNKFNLDRMELSTTRFQFLNLTSSLWDECKFKCLQVFHGHRIQRRRWFNFHEFSLKLHDNHCGDSPRHGLHFRPIWLAVTVTKGAGSMAGQSSFFYPARISILPSERHRLDIRVRRVTGAGSQLIDWMMSFQERQGARTKHTTSE